MKNQENPKNKTFFRQLLTRIVLTITTYLLLISIPTVIDIDLLKKVLELVVIIA